MEDYLFRLEAINLGTTVYDTSDISTIRGGGFYLLNLVHELTTKKPVRNLKKITEGASAAVFESQTNDPEAVRKDLLDYLYKKTNRIKEMMFLVEFIQTTGDFSADMVTLMGKVRLTQMRTASLRIDNNSIVPKPKMNFDELNRVLPAHRSHRKGNLSNFTYKRRDVGVGLRKTLYESQLKKTFPKIPDYQFTENLEELSVNPKRESLSGKIAFIYVDGNKFGTLQNNFDKKDFIKFDQTLHDFKINFLSNVVKLAKTCPSFMVGNQTVRLETLLWGGDEIKIIVPAWMGWRVASLFFELSSAIDPAIKINNDMHQLTYAMGLVFAHHKNPISNITKIAEELLDSIKGRLDKDASYQREKGDKLHYVVLESHETLPQHYTSFASTIYHTDLDNLSFNRGKMNKLENLVDIFLKSGFPKSRIYKAAMAWSLQDRSNYIEVIKKGIDACEREKADIKSLLQRLVENKLIHGNENGEIILDSFPMNVNGYMWIQLSELWDYLEWRA